MRHVWIEKPILRVHLRDLALVADEDRDARAGHHVVHARRAVGARRDEAVPGGVEGHVQHLDDTRWVHRRA